jgi:hypothetical protein
VALTCNDNRLTTPDAALLLLTLAPSLALGSGPQKTCYIRENARIASGRHASHDDISHGRE